MKKILITLLVFLMMSSPCFGITDWIRGDGTDAIKGTDSTSDIDADTTSYLQDPLDRLLTEEIHGCALAWATNATVTIGAGEVTCYNAAKTIKRMRRNTAAVTITLPANGNSGDSLDTGNAAISTWYHVYAIADADATTFTGICSASASAPTGASYTYFRYLGSFYNNASDHINKFYWFGNGSDIRVYYDADQAALTNGNQSSYTDVDCSTFIPPASTEGIFYFDVDTQGSVGTPDYGYMRPNGYTLDFMIGRGGDGSASFFGMQGVIVMPTDASQIIEYKTVTGGGTPTLDISVRGYCFSR